MSSLQNYLFTNLPFFAYVGPFFVYYLHMVSKEDQLITFVFWILGEPLTTTSYPLSMLLCKCFIFFIAVMFPKDL
jgi:hypothetical protein